MNNIGKNTGNLKGSEEPISLMEPMLPEESTLSKELEDIALELIEKAHRLGGQLHPIVQLSVGHLVRSMNCYYSNLIEGHDTHPRDIERALVRDFSKQPQQRNLQLEATAHIAVQKMIDEGVFSPPFMEKGFIQKLHFEFCAKLPEDLLWIENPDTQKKLKVIPGQLRTTMVSVGRHIPPRPENLPHFLARFEEAYQPSSLSKIRRLLAAAASHHRLLWIHPFLDGNGRVTRLLSHAYLKSLGLGSSLWSVSRGLARSVNEYRSHLEVADQPRHHDLDGRGSLSSKALNDFCFYFLKVCIDQIDYMSSLLTPTDLLRRIQLFCEEEERASRLPKKSFTLLREALLAGEIERGRASSITGYGERQARTVLNDLVKKNLLISETPKGPVRLAFPTCVVERWFPLLYPHKL